MVENIVAKGENAGYQHFLLFLQCFEKLSFPEVLKVGLCGKGELNSIQTFFFSIFCRHLTRDVLVQQYNIVDPGVLERLQKAIRKAKEEDTTDEEVSFDLFLTLF